MGQSRSQDARSSTAGTRTAATILFPITVSGCTDMGSHGREWTWKADVHPDPTGAGGGRLDLSHRASKVIYADLVQGAGFPEMLAASQALPHPTGRQLAGDQAEPLPSWIPTPAIQHRRGPLR